MGFDQHMGDHYPLTLADKLKVITEPPAWYARESGAESPWGRAIIPIEMISVLLGTTSAESGLSGRKPAVGLSAGQEIRLIKGPLFVDPDYELEREIVALSESARMESVWARTRIFKGSAARPLVAEMILNWGGDEGVLSGVCGGGTETWDGLIQRVQSFMRYWWVNQNQTYRHEVRGGYLWSPKRKANQAQNPFYDFMREVAPGDVVFSFANTVIRAIGIAGSHAYEAPKPLEFGHAGAYWDKIGWRIDVRFSQLRLPIRPSEHMSMLAPLLPDRYAPLRPNGAGMQSVYLTRIPDQLAAALVDLLGAEARDLVLGYRVADESSAGSAVGLVEWEEHELNQVQLDLSLPETERQAIVLARRGQGSSRSA